MSSSEIKLGEILDTMIRQIDDLTSAVQTLNERIIELETRAKAETNIEPISINVADIDKERGAALLRFLEQMFGPVGEIAIRT